MSESFSNQGSSDAVRSSAMVSASDCGLVLLVAAVGAAAFALRSMWPRIAEERIRETVVSTLAREAQESFDVTGTLNISSSVESRSEKTFLPGILHQNVGTTMATVRVPGRIAYGFNVAALRPEHIHYNDDGVVEVELPRLEVFSVEPELENVEIRTEVGWARLHRSSGQEMEQRALQAIRPTMRATAERHLANSETPQLNTAEALARLLTPPLEAGGVSAPQFRFHLASGGILELGASGAPSTE